jgi:hypothetical protein
VETLADEYRLTLDELIGKRFFRRHFPADIEILVDDLYGFFRDLRPHVT